MAKNKRSIRRKLFTSFMLINLILVAAMGVGLALHYLLQNLDKDLEQLRQDQQVLDDIIKKELMFLHSESTNFDFHSSGSDDRLAYIRATYDSLHLNLKLNSALYEQHLLHDIDSTASIDLIYQHQHLFFDLLDKIKERGTKDYGTIGEMREAIHALESKAQYLSLDEILSLRRREKDFLLRHDQVYVDMLDAEVNQLTAKYGHIPAFHSYDLPLLEDYHSKFKQVVSLVNEIGDFSQEGLKYEFEQSIMDINNLDIQVSAIYSHKREEIAEGILWGFIITLVFAIGMGVFAALILSDYRSKPLKELTEKINDITNGDAPLQEINYQTIPNISTEHEQLISSFNDLITNLTNHIDIVKQSNTKLHDKNEELVKVNKELDQFVYSVSHDIRAPLTSVHGLVNLLKMDKSKASNDQFIVLIEDRIKKLDDFIKDIIDLSRNSRLQVSREKIDMQELFNEILQDHQFFDRSEQVEQAVEIKGSGEFYSDRKRLKVILSNLLSNAIRFSDPYKHASRIVISVSIGEESASIQIWDNGVGIPEEMIQKVFDMFYRASEKSKGSGLGLYIVKESVRKIGGELSLNSVSGEWTEFILTVPNLHEHVKQNTDKELIEAGI